METAVTKKSASGIRFARETAWCGSMKGMSSA